MTYNIHREKDYSLATITAKKNQTVSALITIDIHIENTAAIQAILTMYPDAILSGTLKKTRAEFLHASNLLGGSIGVSVHNGNVTISLKSTSDMFGKLLKLVEEMLLTPSFEKTEVKRIKSTTINELHDSKEDSKSIAQAELVNTIYGEGDRRSSADIDTTIGEVENVSVKQLKKVHTTVLSHTWTCSIAAEKQYCEAFNTFIKKVKKKSMHTTAIAVHQQKPPKQTVSLKDIPSRQNIDFSIGAPLPFTLHHPDYVPLSFGIAVLAMWGGFAGRLMSTVREKEGLTYGIYGQLETFSGTEQGYWRIATFFAPDKAEEGLKSTFREIIQIHKKGITEDELLRFKTILKTREALLGDSIVSQLRNLHTYNCHGFSLAEMEERKEKIDAVTVSEVNQALSMYLNPSTLTIGAAGPIKSVKKDIETFLKSV